MIIDLILDRRDAVRESRIDRYNEQAFKAEVRAYVEVFDSDIMRNILRAFRSRKETNVKDALCSYVIGEGYSEDICDYINSTMWLEEHCSPYIAQVVY